MFSRRNSLIARFRTVATNLHRSAPNTCSKRFQREKLDNASRVKKFLETS